MPLGRHKLAFSTNKSVRKQSAAGDNWQASTSAKSPPRPRRICSVQCTDHSTAWLPARDISPSVVRTYNACKHRRQNIDKRFSFRRETALGNPSFGRNISGMTPLNSYGTSVQNLPPLHFPAGHFELANSGKLLGINLDADFSWKSHAEAITSKATQRLYFLKQLRCVGVPQDQLLHFYTVVIRPVLEYAAPVWNHLLTKTQLDQLEAIQRRAHLQLH